jgi:DNA replication licensing factor MCM2
MRSSDYADNAVLDTYSDSGLNDADEFEPMAAATRRAAEAKMRQRDRAERGGRRGMRAANRSHAPNFFDSDDASVGDDADSGLLSGTRTRARRQYDERRDVDDMEGIEDVRLGFCCALYC